MRSQPGQSLNLEVPAFRVCGDAAITLDVSGPAFDETQQRRLQALNGRLKGLERPHWVIETVLGVNNLMVVFDPLQIRFNLAAAALLELWECSEPLLNPGKDVDIAVEYGGEVGEDLKSSADWAGLSVEDLIQLHSRAIYKVACIGAMPGFAYLYGLPQELFRPRRSEPRTRLPAGSVVIGGGLASVMPVAGPSGWHSIGLGDTPLFDPYGQEPCLLQPGDRVRFVVKGIRL